jgi:hypothetical protein
MAAVQRIATNGQRLPNGAPGVVGSTFYACMLAGCDTPGQSGESGAKGIVPERSLR